MLRYNKPYPTQCQATSKPHTCTICRPRPLQNRHQLWKHEDSLAPHIEMGQPAKSGLSNLQHAQRQAQQLKTETRRERVAHHTQRKQQGTRTTCTVNLADGTKKMLHMPVVLVFVHRILHVHRTFAVSWISHRRAELRTPFLLQYRELYWQLTVIPRVTLRVAISKTYVARETWLATLAHENSQQEKDAKCACQWLSYMR